jgi:hypothetical protein
MQNNQWQWVPWILGLLGGGAMGAIIAAFINYLKNRRQPVGYQKDTIDIFRKKRDHPKLAARLLAREHPFGTGPEQEIDTLSLARVSLTNLGNQDLAKFTFGITMSEGSKIIDMRMKEPDRHHVMKVIMPEDRAKPLTELDFTLEPFNRGEKYNVSIYFTYGENPIDITVSSPHPTRFINLRNMSVIVGVPLRTEWLMFLFSFFFAAVMVAITLITFGAIKLIHYFSP